MKAALDWFECHHFDPLDVCARTVCPLHSPCSVVQHCLRLVGACSEDFGDCPSADGYPDGPCEDCTHRKVCGALDGIPEEMPAGGYCIDAEAGE